MLNRRWLFALLAGLALTVGPVVGPVTAQDDGGEVVEDPTDGTDDGETDDDGDVDEDDGDGDGDGPGLKVVPPRGKVQVGKDRRFRVAGGRSQGLAWTLVDASDPSAAMLDGEGRLTALAGGWAVVGVEDTTTMEVVAMTDTVWLAGGPTPIGRRGGRAFAASDTFVTVSFPPNASQRAMTVLLEKRGLNELPEQARGRGTAVSVFEFDVTDSDTGEDIGGTEGFDEGVDLTLTYDEDLLPEGVTEEDLVIATFDEVEEAWDEITGDAVIEVDTENNTITVETTHASLWAVMDGNTVDPIPTAVKSASWGQVKKGALGE